MENRIIKIANTKTQKRYAIETAAVTLGELMDQMTAQGIDFTGMTFTEGITKTQLLSRDSALPTNVIYKGQPTNNLVMLLTNTSKNIASGAIDRKEAYRLIKELSLQDEVKEAFGRNYTQVPTTQLEAFINSVSEEVMVENHVIDENGNVTADKISVKTAPHADTVEWFYMGLKAMLKSNLLYADDIAVIADLTTELYKRLKEAQPQISDEDIENMIASL